MSDRVRVIEHGIVLQDFSYAEPIEARAAIAEARAFMETQPRGSVLLLTDVSGSSFDQGVVDAIRELAAHHKPWVKASALVGLTPLMRVLYRAIVALTGRDIRVFETRAEAIGHLVSRAISGPASAPDASRQKP